MDKDWIIIITNKKQNRQPEVTDYMDKDGYNGYTAYLFIGYHFCIEYTWIIICNLQIQLLQLLLTF